MEPRDYAKEKFAGLSGRVSKIAELRHQIEHNTDEIAYFSGALKYLDATLVMRNADGHPVHVELDAHDIRIVCDGLIARRAVQRKTLERAVANIYKKIGELA